MYLYCPKESMLAEWLMLNCTGSPLQSLPPAQLPYSLVNFCVVLSARCWEEGWLKQQNSLVSFVPVCVEIVILFGVWCRLEVVEAAGVWELHPYGWFQNANIHLSASAVWTCLMDPRICFPPTACTCSVKWWLSLGSQCIWAFMLLRALCSLHRHFICFLASECQHNR